MVEPLLRLVRGVLAGAVVAACSPNASDKADTIAAAHDSGNVVRVDSAVARSPAMRESLAARGVTPVAGTGDSTAADTARGIVRRYGAEPLTRLALATDGGSGELLALSGTQMSELAAAEGLEIMIIGVRTSERAFEVAPGGAVVFRVEEFAVRAVDGVEARDGILREMNGHPVLEYATGVREPLVGLPLALKSQIGARIFLAGPRGSAPHAFGVLRKP